MLQPFNELLRNPSEKSKKAKLCNMTLKNKKMMKNKQNYDRNYKK